MPKWLERKTQGIDGRLPITRFLRQLEERRKAFTREEIAARLGDRTPLKAEQKPISQFPLELDDFVRDRTAPVTALKREGIYGFDLEGIEEDNGPGKPKVKLWAGENEVQQRFRMQLWIEAIDNDIETGRDKGVTNRNRGVSKQKFTFMVVSEAELLVEIGREEQRLFDDFKRVVDELIKVRTLMATTLSDLTVTKDLNDNYFNSKQIEVAELEDSLEKQLGVTNKVADDYERILNEMRINRIKTEGITGKVENKLVVPLDFIRRFHFVATKDKFGAYHKALDATAGKSPAARAEESRKMAEEAQTNLQVLIDACNEVLNEMQGVKTFNELIKLLRNMEEKEQNSLEAIMARKKKLLDDLDKGIQ